MISRKIVKNQQYWHAAISFGPALSACYSFNYGEEYTNKFKGGLSFESIDLYKEDCPTGTMQVGVIFVTPEKFNKVKEALNYFIHNKEKTKYSFINLFYSWLGKPTKNGLKLAQVCSTFVDTLLKYANININHIQTNLVKPDDLKYTNDKSYFKVYEGNIVDYQEEPVMRRSLQLANRVKNDYFRNEKDEEIEDITVKKR